MPHTRSLILPLMIPLLLGCAMQRAVDAGTAQRQMVGMDKEQVFACMGIPHKTATVGGTEIWSYKSGNGWSTKTSSTTSTSLTNDFTAAFALKDETREKRFCTVQIVMAQDHVKAVHYNGPTGGFLTEDEQCAFAVRNCI